MFHIPLLSGFKTSSTTENITGLDALLLCLVYAYCQ